MRRVLIESPYAGDVVGNLAYAKRCVLDSLSKGEAPIASHLLFTMDGILNDAVTTERNLGIAAGLAWRDVADMVVFYVDKGWSSGMMAARSLYDSEGRPYEVRTLDAQTV